MVRIAIFTSPKPFVDPHITTIQRNAIQSWKALGNSVEVWLIGEETGLKETANELGVNYILEVERNSYGTPRIDSIFNMVRSKCAAEYCCYVNSDILLFPDLFKTVEFVREKQERFLLVGQRWDMNVKEELEINENWSDSFLKRTYSEGKLHAPAGSDYFIFPRNCFQEIPQFSVGRAGWDNWMIFHARQSGIACINATGAITAVHQNHDFSHLPQGRIHRMQPESLENMKLAGGRSHMFTLADVSHKIENSQIIHPDFSRERMMREIGIFPLLHLKPVWFAQAVYTLLNPKRAATDRKKDKKMKNEISKTTGGSL